MAEGGCYMSVGDELKEFVETMTREIVDIPEEVSAAILESGNTVVIELSVAPSDIGKVIGREGRMAQSLRTILGGVSTKLGKKSILQVMDD
jgi:uncharacterized protein